MDSHRSTSSSKRSQNQSELLAGITNLEPSLSKKGPLFQELKEINTPKAPSIRYSDNSRAMQLESYGLCSSRGQL